MLITSQIRAMYFLYVHMNLRYAYKICTYKITLEFTCLQYEVVYKEHPPPPPLPLKKNIIKYIPSTLVELCNAVLTACV